MAESGLQQELEDYQVEYYGEEISPGEMIFKELLENFDVSLGEPKVLSALNGLASLYETLTDVQAEIQFHLLKRMITLTILILNQRILLSIRLGIQISKLLLAEAFV